jgi:hypothetical protein
MLQASRKASKVSEALVWYHFVPASGPEGAAWYAEYRDSGCEALAQKLDVSVSLLRQRRLAEGQTLLDSCRSTLEQLGRQGLSRSVHGVVEEAYCTAQAYLHYHNEQYAAARQALDEGQRVLQEVVTEAPFLIPFAIRCYDFCLHYARVARGQRDWPLMWESIQRGREMVKSQRPLCEMENGSISMDDVEAFFRAVKPADEFEREALGATLIATAVVPW